MKNQILATLLLAASLASYGQSCAPWGCHTTIDSLYTNVSGLIYVSTAGDETKANGTVYPGNYFILDPNKHNADKVYACMLAAYMTNKILHYALKQAALIASCLMSI